MRGLELDEAVHGFGVAVGRAVGVEVREQGLGPLLQGPTQAPHFGDETGRQDLDEPLRAGAPSCGALALE